MIVVGYEPGIGRAQMEVGLADARDLGEHVEGGLGGLFQPVGRNIDEQSRGHKVVVVGLRGRDLTTYQAGALELSQPLKRIGRLEMEGTTVGPAGCLVQPVKPLLFLLDALSLEALDCLVRRVDSETRVVGNLGGFVAGMAKQVAQDHELGGGSHNSLVIDNSIWMLRDYSTYLYIIF